jgi:hypothetical protein
MVLGLLGIPYKMIVAAGQHDICTVIRGVDDFANQESACLGVTLPSQGFMGKSLKKEAAATVAIYCLSESYKGSLPESKVSIRSQRDRVTGLTRCILNSHCANELNPMLYAAYSSPCVGGFFNFRFSSV